MNAILILAIVIIVLFHLLWYMVSRRYQNRQLPSDQSLRQYQDNIFQQMQITVDQSVMEETYIDANGYRLHLILAEAARDATPDAPTLVFIPGTTAYAMVYAQFCYDMYQQGFNIIGFDPRGHGQSSGPRGDYTISGLVDDTLAVVRYARKRFGGKVALAGSSQGGIVAFYAAARDATIDAAVCHNIADLNGKDNLILSLLRPPKFLVPAARFLMTLYGRFSIPISLYLDLKQETFPDGSDAATLVKNDPLAISWITFRALNSLLRTDLPTAVENITVPIMLIHAGKDNIFPQSYVEGIYNRLTCPKKYLLLNNTEHLVMTNDVDQVVPPVTEWLRNVMG